MARNVSRRHRSRAGLKASTSVNLISMMDILTVLLLFLLKSYVAGGEVMVPAPGIHLPASTADAPPPSSVVVAIAGGEIMVSGEHAASMKEALQSDGLEIASLSARLQAIQAQQDEIARLRGGKSEGRTVTIQGDRDIEFKVLQKVMYTLGQNGYENISLAVLQKS